MSEDWKERAKREAEELDRQFEREKKEAQFDFSGVPTFVEFLQNLAANALMALGEAPDPITKSKDVNLPRAKYLIDLLILLKEKTRGNLTADEEEFLERTLTELQLKFVEVYNRLKEETK